MLAYRIEGIIGESLCKDENDRNAVAEMKHKYANRSEVFNNRFGKNAYIFIADTSEGSITLGAFVTDLQKISAIVDSYAQHMGIQMTDIVISEVTLKKLYGLLSKAESQNFIQDTNEILEEFGLDEIVGDYVRYLEYKEYIVKKGTADSWPLPANILCNSKWKVSLIQYLASLHRSRLAVPFFTIYSLYSKYRT